jgi:hypothetical protein
VPGGYFQRYRERAFLPRWASMMMNTANPTASTIKMVKRMFIIFMLLDKNSAQTTQDNVGNRDISRIAVNRAQNGAFPPLELTKYSRIHIVMPSSNHHLWCAAGANTVKKSRCAIN